jgi:hypothetical protein
MLTINLKHLFTVVQRHDGITNHFQAELPGTTSPIRGANGNARVTAVSQCEHPP